MATTPSPTGPHVTSPTNGRRFAGVLRLVASVVLISALVTQIVDLATHDALVPSEYFAYFTIQSSSFNVLVLVAGGVLALRVPVDSTRFTMVRVAILTYAIVTGVVYNLLLRGVASGDYVGTQWPNEVMHVWIPLFILVDWLFADWLFAPGRPGIRWSTIWLVVSYPIIWVAATLLRGAITGWYPYPFLEPTGPTGYLSVVEYILGLSVFIVALACGAIALSRRRSR